MVRHSSTEPRLLLCIVALSMSTACGSGDGNGVTPPPATTISKGFSGSGDAQSGRVAQPLVNPIQVIVTENGVAAAGKTVTWSTTVPGASLAATSTTDGQGIAGNTWTLGTVSGPQTAQASLNGASGSPVTFTATAAPAAPASLSKVAGDQQEAAVNTQLSSSVQAKVSDEFGNGVPDVAVAWAVIGGTPSAPIVLTDASGASAVRVTLGSTAGPITITATADGLLGSPATFTATALPPGTGTAAVSVVNNSFSPSALTITAGTTVTWTWVTSARQHNVAPDGVVPTRSGPLIDGPAQYNFRFDTPGTYRYYCELHGGPGGSGMSGTITVQ
jgi:plastocyanin